MAKYPALITCTHKSGKIEGYKITTPRPCFVLGKYDEANTGGADTFKDMADVEEIIYRRYGEGQDIIFEGIRVHGAHTRWIEFAQRNRDVIDKRSTSS